jgi:hypothetical protein
MATVAGMVLDAAGNPAVGRIVRAYRRDTGALIGVSETADGTNLTAGPNWSAVKLLMHFDGTPDSTTFVDETGGTFTAVGAAKLSDNRTRYGRTSLLLPGASGLTATANSTGLDLTNQDFTVEGSVFYAASAGGEKTVVGKWAGSNLSWIITINSSNRLTFYYFTTSADYGKITTVTVPIGEWFDFAVCRKSNVLTMYINGVARGSWAFTANIKTVSQALTIGHNVGTGYLNGSVGTIRVTVGHCWYDGAFDPQRTLFRDAHAGVLPAGEYSVRCNHYVGEIQRIVLDDDGGSLHNDLIDRIDIA